MMKKALSIILAVSLLMAWWSQPTIVKANDPLFPDPALKQIVEEWVGLPTAHSDFLQELELRAQGIFPSLAGRGIADLSGMELFEGTGLVHLNLQSNDISDLTPISGIDTLRGLELGQNQNLKNLMPLRHLSQLTSLDISYNQMTDAEFEAVRHLTSLRVLSANNNEITTLAPLEDLNNLNQLNMFNNRLTDIRALSGKSIEWLNLGNNRLSDVSALLGMPIQPLFSTMVNNFVDVWTSGPNQLVAAAFGESDGSQQKLVTADQADSLTDRLTLSVGDTGNLQLWSFNSFDGQTWMNPGYPYYNGGYANQSDYWREASIVSDDPSIVSVEPNISGNPGFHLVGMAGGETYVTYYLFGVDSPLTRQRVNITVTAPLAPTPQPTSTPVSTPTPTLEPTPEPTPEPTAAPTPIAPVPSVEPTPETSTEPSPTPSPVAEPTPGSTFTPESVIAVTPDPEATPMPTEESPEQLGRIQGKVTFLGRTALPNVPVAINDGEQETVTDHEGRYSFEQVPLGASTLRLTEPAILLEWGAVLASFGERTFEQTVVSVALSEAEPKSVVDFHVFPNQIPTVTKSEPELESEPEPTTTPTPEPINKPEVKLIEEPQREFDFVVEKTSSLPTPSSTSLAQPKPEWPEQAVAIPLPDEPEPAVIEEEPSPETQEPPLVVEEPSEPKKGLWEWLVPLNVGIALSSSAFFFWRRSRNVWILKSGQVVRKLRVSPSDTLVIYLDSIEAGAGQLLLKESLVNAYPLAEVSLFHHGNIILHTQLDGKYGDQKLTFYV